MASNPNPARIPDALWYLWEELHKLEPSSQLGGIYADKPGYHNTRNANDPHNYSVVDQEDKGGPGDKAAAIDWTFPEAQSGDYSRIKKYSKRLLDSGKDANDSRMDGFREFFGNADDDREVEGWDYRYVQPSTSDDSHLWHIHLSVDRDSLNRETMDRALEVIRGDDMALSDDDILKIAKKVWTLDGVKEAPDAPKPPYEDPDYATNPNWAAKSYLRRTYESVGHGLTNDEAVTVALTELGDKVNQILAILSGGVPIPGLVNVSEESAQHIANLTADEIHNDPERDG